MLVRAYCALRTGDASPICVTACVTRQERDVSFRMPLLTEVTQDCRAVLIVSDSRYLNFDRLASHQGSLPLFAAAGEDR
jgi:hypothetical protein